MATTIHGQRLSITAACEPGARSSRARTKSGTLRRQARRWCNGLAWSARLQALDRQFPLQPPFEVTVHSYFPPPELDQVPRPQEWFESIGIALGTALGVDPAQVHLRAGRLAYTPPFSLPHFEIVVTSSEPALPLATPITCPSCGAQWLLDAGLHTDDRCPHCDYEGAGLPFMLGLL